MAKFCANCGSTMDDADRVCGQCGTPATNETPASNEVPAAPEAGDKPAKAPMDESKRNRIVAYVVCGIVALIVLVVAINIVSKLNSYEPTIKKTLTALKKEDVTTLSEVASLIYEGRGEKWYGDKFDAEEEIEREINSVLNQFETDVKGEIKSISYEYDKDDVTKLSDRKVRLIKEALEDDYDVDASSIKKIYRIKLSVIVKGESKKKSYKVSSPFYVIKEEGGWKVYYGFSLEDLASK